MQSVVIDKPCTFIPPRFSHFWHWVVRRILPRKEGKVVAIEVTAARDKSQEHDPLTVEIRRQMEALLEWLFGGNFRNAWSMKPGMSVVPPGEDARHPRRQQVHREDARHSNTRCRCHGGLAG